MNNLLRIKRHIDTYLEEVEEELKEANFQHRYREIAILSKLTTDRLNKIYEDAIVGAIQDEIYPGAHKNAKYIDKLIDDEKDFIEKEYLKPEPKIY